MRFKMKGPVIIKMCHIILTYKSKLWFVFVDILHLHRHIIRFMDHKTFERGQNNLYIGSKFA